MEQIVQVLFFLGAFQGFLLAVFLFSIKSNKISNIFLGILTLLWGFILIGFPLQSYGVFVNYPHLLRIIPSFLLLISPLLYLYIKYLISDIKKISKSDLLHALPYVLYTLLLIPFYILSGQDKLDLIAHPNTYFGTLESITAEVIAIQGLLYSFFAFKRLLKYDSIIENYQSTVYRDSLKILKTGTILVFLAWILGTIAIHLQFFGVNVGIDLFMYVYLILVLVIYFISFMSLRTPEIFKLQEESFGSEKSAEIEISIKQNDKTISLEMIEELDKDTSLILDKLKQHMEENKPYLNPDLSLQDLADQMSLSRNQISALINQQYHKNFFEFVNYFRVNEVKILMELPENKNLKLMSLAYDAGFNSKSSFNRVFKQQTQMTPSEYFKSMEKEV